MRIVQFIPGFSLGGIEKAGCVLGAAMARMGHHTSVIGLEGGPRLGTAGQLNLTHRVLLTPDEQAQGRELSADDVASRLMEDDPDVIHVHYAFYREALIDALSERIAQRGTRGPLLVSTPVFGRPPISGHVLPLTRTCCVGIYTFYRLGRWLRLTPEQAVREGIGYVPLTPFQPPSCPVSANDEPPAIAHRRAELGLPVDAFVVGRIGRNSPSKWHVGTELLVDSLLRLDANVCWLSVGFPEERGLSRLQTRWGDRFCNLSETGDYDRLMNAMAAIDIQIFASNNGECFASTIAEAAGVGVPTIALATPMKDNGQAEQVISQVTGSLVSTLSAVAEEVEALRRDPPRLARLKRSAQEHARTHWHQERAAADLVELYEGWLRPDENNLFPYARRMLEEAVPFARTYRRNMADLMGATPAGRAKWRLILAAVEWWPMFRIGRAIKRWRHREPIDTKRLTL